MDVGGIEFGEGRSWRSEAGANATVPALRSNHRCSVSHRKQEEERGSKAQTLWDRLGRIQQRLDRGG